MRRKTKNWAEFDATWGIGNEPEKKGIVTRVREKLLNYWIERQNQKNS